MMDFEMAGDEPPQRQPIAMAGTKSTLEPMPGTIVRESIDRRHLHPGDPEYGRPKQPINEKPAKRDLSDEKEKQRNSDIARNRIAFDELLADGNFDASLEASRRRLELALAITSESALRKARGGCVSEGSIEFIQSVASTYRILVNTTPQKPPSEMSEEELRAAAGK